MVNPRSKMIVKKRREMLDADEIVEGLDVTAIIRLDVALEFALTKIGVAPNSQLIPTGGFRQEREMSPWNALTD
jgi:hypothetical protein